MENAGLPQNEIFIGVHERTARLACVPRQIRMHNDLYNMVDVGVHMLEMAGHNTKRDVEKKCTAQQMQDRLIRVKNATSGDFIFMNLNDLVDYCKVNDPVLEVIFHPVSVSVETNKSDLIVHQPDKMQIIRSCFASIPAKMCAMPYHELMEFLWNKYLELQYVYTVVDDQLEIVARARIRGEAQITFARYYEMFKESTAQASVRKMRRSALGYSIAIDDFDCEGVTIPHKEANTAEFAEKYDILIWSTNPSNHNCVDLETLCVAYFGNSATTHLMLKNLKESMSEKRGPAQLQNAILEVHIPVRDPLSGCFSLTQMCQSWAVRPQSLKFVIDIIELLMASLHATNAHQPPTPPLDRHQISQCIDTSLDNLLDAFKLELTKVKSQIVEEVWRRAFDTPAS